MRIFSLLTLLLTFPLTAIAATTDLLPARWLPAGTYGGNQASFEVDAHSARLELPCATATIEHRPVLDERGAFTAVGSYGTRLALAPERTGYPATFTGHLVGQSLWVRVTVRGHGTEQSFDYGPLDFGQQARFFRCL